MYNCSSNSFPRKVATLQINKYWSNVLSLAKKANIPEDKIGVRVNFSRYPYEMGVFDYHTEVESELAWTREPYRPMVANEVIQRSRGGHRCTMLLVVNPDGKEIPSLVYLDAGPKASAGNLGDNSFGVSYTDELGNRLVPGGNDVLGKPCGSLEIGLSIIPSRFGGLIVISSTKSLARL